MEAAEAMRIVRTMVFVPPLRCRKLICSQRKLSRNPEATTAATALSFLAGGMMIARNIPNRATERALTSRAGRMFPAMINNYTPRNYS